LLCQIVILIASRCRYDTCFAKRGYIQLLQTFVDEAERETEYNIVYPNATIAQPGPTIRENALPTSIAIVCEANEEQILRVNRDLGKQLCVAG